MSNQHQWIPIVNASETVWNNITVLHRKGIMLALPSDIRLEWKWLAVANAQPHNAIFYIFYYKLNE